MKQLEAARRAQGVQAPLDAQRVVEITAALRKPVLRERHREVVGTDSAEDLDLLHSFRKSDGTVAVAVSVVIPARNASATLGDQLEGLLSQDYEGSWEVVLVDNGSTDRTAAICEEYRARGLNLRVATCAEPGVNRARNTGVRSALGERILCCDADDIVSSAWVRELAGALDQHDLAGGRIEVDMLNAPILVQARPNESDKGLPKNFDHLPFSMSANLGFHRAVFDALDGFDETFVRGGGDETDFCWRAQYKGYTLGFVPGAVVHYRYRDDLRGFCKQFASYALGSARLRKKHEELGELPPLSRAAVRTEFWRQFKSVAHVELLLDREARYRYLGRVSWFYGACIGYLRFRVLV